MVHIDPSIVRQVPSRIVKLTGQVEGHRDRRRAIHVVGPICDRRVFCSGFKGHSGLLIIGVGAKHCSRHIAQLKLQNGIATFSSRINTGRNVGLG